LFFISPDSDGFWIAREADLQIGGIFLFRRSAMRFARRHTKPAGCATMILSEPHDLDMENRGNQFITPLRAGKRLLRRLTLQPISLFDRVFKKGSKLAARVARAHIAQRMHRAAIEIELYRGCYKYSSKNNDDLQAIR
jgi:hypothetical protein